MKKLTELTAEQEAMIIPQRELWLNKFYKNKGVDKEKATECIKWLYEFCGKKEPVVIFMDSPIGCQVMANLSSDRANILANIRDNIRDNIWDNILDNIGANIRANIGANILDNIRANIRDNIGDNIRDNIMANIRDNIWDKYINPCGWINLSDYGWIAFYEYFQNLNYFTDYDWSNFDNIKNLNSCGIYEIIALDGMCIVCSMPKVIQDAENILHSIFTPAVVFHDGFAMHYIHGVYIKDDVWSRLQNETYSFEDWVKEENEEIKSACLAFMDEKHGSEYVYRFLSSHLKEVDNFVDKKDEKYLEGTTKGMNVGVYTLFKGGYGEVELAFVRCYCPSTDRMFFLSVDPVNNNAKDAIASLYRIPSKVKGEIKYIQRQGERFSTVLTDKGNDIISKLSKEEVSDLVSISGEEYFSKMRYEF